jgi:aminoglycoside phosphotransferase (APT) family kinase protein
MHLPEDKRSAVERALTTVFGGATLDGLAPLNGGLSGARVYRIRVGGVAYLLRIEGARDLVRDPVRGYACMKIAAQALLAPRVLYACAEDGVAITDFIAEKSLTFDYAGTRSDLVVELAQAARSLHATPGFPPLIGYLDALDQMMAGLAASGLLAPRALAEPLARYRALTAAYRRLEPDLVSSHNDLNPRNILFDGQRLWLIDWEAAFRADRYVDLAALANGFANDTASEALFLRTYFTGQPGEARQARLFLARQISHVFHALAFLNGVAAQRPDLRLASLDAPSLEDLHLALAAGEPVLDTGEGRLAYGLARLDTATRNLSGDGFEAAARRAAQGSSLGLSSMAH